MPKKLVCGYCGRNDSVKEILYGMPGDDFDYGTFISGGCIPEDVAARCASCGWEKLKVNGFLNEGGRG